MGKHLVLVGAGHAHLTCLTSLRDFADRGHRVTVVGPAVHHYYSGMGPGMLGETYRPQQLRFNSQKMAEAGGARFIKAAVSRVLPVERQLVLSTGAALPYDVVSFNVGSGVPQGDLAIKNDTDVFTVKPIEQLLCAQKSIVARLGAKPLDIVVAGGGPAGVEIAGNLWRLVTNHQGTATITMVAGRRLMHGLPDEVRQRVLASFLRRDIRVLEDCRLHGIETGQVRLTGDRELPWDFLFLALGVRAPSLFQDSGLPTGPDSGLLVNEFLQSAAHPEIFGGGDCIYFQPQPLDKVGVYAVRENMILRDNLLAALEGRGLTPFKPQQTYLLIFNMGDGQGIFWRKNVVLGCNLAFRLKDYIDRKFMRKFQISGELDEL